MPIARIIASIPCRTAALAERLRAFGYTVETVEPGQESDGRADLEVNVREGKTAEILQELAGRKPGCDPDVYIAAGALSGTPDAVQNAPQNASSVSTAAPVYAAGPPTIADTMNGVAAGLQNKRDLLAKALREQRAILRQARIAERQTTRRQGVAPAASESAFEPGQVFDDASDSGRPNYDADPERVTLSEESGMPEPGVAAWAGEGPRSGSGRPEDFATAQEFGAPPESTQTEYSSAVGGLAAEPTSSASGSLKASRSPRKRAIRIVIPGGRHMSRRAREWRAAALISCLFAGLLMLGWAAVTREPVSPLPKSLTSQTGLEEALPFGAATIKPTASAATIAAHADRVAGHATTADAADAEKQTGPSTKINTRPAADRQKSASRETARKQQRPRSAKEEETAEDEVIIHRRSPAPAVGNEKASLKRFSD